MSILRNLSNFNVPIKDLLHIYKLYIRSVIEQSSVVWSSSITTEEMDAYERTQRIAMKLIYQQNYVSYDFALSLSNLPKISERFAILRLKFALKCSQNEKTSYMFPLNTNHDTIKTRHREVYKVPFASHTWVQASAIPVMSKQLNEYFMKNTQA